MLRSFCAFGWILVLYGILPLANAHVDLGASSKARVRGEGWVNVPDEPEERMIKFINTTAIFGKGQKFDYDIAKEQCKTQRAHLITLHSSRDKIKIAEMAQSLQQNSVMLITGLAQVDSLSWADGTAINAAFTSDEINKVIDQKNEYRLCHYLIVKKNDYIVNDKLEKCSGITTSDSTFVVCEK